MQSGPVRYSAGSLKLLTPPRPNTSVSGAKAVLCIDDMTTILPPELSLDMEAIAKVMEWLQKYLGEKVVGPVQGWSRARISDGRAAYGDGWHRAHGGPTGDDCSGNTSWNSTFQAIFLAGSG